MKCPKCRTENPDHSHFCGECGTPLTVSEGEPASHTETLQSPAVELTPGVLFAERYQIIEELGKGGMGKVYKVIDRKLKEKVALKLIKHEIADDKRTIERFSNELRVARKISHKNVCRMFDLSEYRGVHHITMEYVPGEDLKSTLKRIGPLGAGKAVAVAKQVCEGLAEAGRLGVVHRDLKPQNVMIDREGNVRIMDFGIARFLKAKGITDTGVMIGTPEYMSPEQVEGQEADHRSDIYSLGVILYEMVTGRVPFEGETPLSIALKHKSIPPSDPRALNAQIPPELSRLILKCLEKDKQKRYQTADQLLSDLTKIEKKLPSTERMALKRKPITAREITVSFGLKKLFVPALILVAAAITAVLIWRLLPRKEIVPLPAGKPSLAVMHFKNNTGEEDLDHWGSALSDLMIADLSQSRFLKVMSGEKLFQILDQLHLLEARSYSSHDLKQVASRGGTGHIIVGDYSKAGNIFRINVALQEAATGELVGSERVEGKGEESIFAMVDALTRRIKTNFKLSAEEIAGDIDYEVGQITTSSPEALKYYSEAEKYYNKGDYRLSIQFFERAVAVDPEFAMAYRGLGRAYGNLGYDSQWKKHIQKALDLKDRVSEKERYRIQVDFYRRSEKTWAKAIEAYNKLLELYPEDESANFNLGALYMYIEQWDRAVEKFEVNRKNKVEHFFTYVNLARSFMAKGMYERAGEVLENYRNDFQDNPVIHFYLAHNYLSQEKYDQALAEMDKAHALNPTLHRHFVIKGDIYHAQGDWEAAEQSYQKLLEADEPTAHLYGRDRLGPLFLVQGKFEASKQQAELGIALAEKMGEMEWKAGFHFDLAYRYLATDNPQQAAAECERAMESAGQAENLSLRKRALHLKGLAYLEMKSIDRAQEAAQELYQLIRQGLNEKEMRYYHHLLGCAALQEENPAQAVEYFRKAQSLLCDQYPWIPRNDHALFFDSLASAYGKRGDLEKAQKEYQRIAALTLGRLNYGDIYARSFYNQGKIYEKEGQKEKAVQCYQKYLKLWEEADPGTAEVADAKKRLIHLLTWIIHE
ncbi:MAG: protein kinase domain-containing protein [Candidatus Aminicenantes bacterium]